MSIILNLKHILFISHSSSIHGGAEDDFERLLKYYSADKTNQIDVFVPPGPRAFTYGKYCSNIGLYKWGYLPLFYKGIFSYLKFIIKSLIQIVQLFRFIGNRRYDLAVLNVSVIPFILIPLKYRQIKTIVFIREIVEPKFIRNILFKILHRYSDYFIAISDKIRDEFTSVTGDNNIKVIKTCIEDFSESSFEDISLEKNIEDILADTTCFKIISIGAVAFNKNQLLQVKAFDKLISTYPDSNFKWLCIGYYNKKESYFKKLKSFLKSNNAEDRFIFLGSMDKLSTYKILKSSNLVVITSIKEGYSMVMLESLMFKKPLVTTPIADITSIIKHKHNGFIIDYSDKALADTIISVYKEPKSVSKIVEEGYKTFISINDLEDNLKKTKFVFDKVMAD